MREPDTEDEIQMLLDRSPQPGEIEQPEREMIYKVFDFADKEVDEVMVPRTEVVALSVDRRPRTPRRRHRLAVHALPGLPRLARRHRRDPARARPVLGDNDVGIEGSGRGAGAPALHGSGDEGSGRAARRVPEDQSAHGDRHRRVRLHGGDRDARGPARGDRRRDRGRVRPPGRRHGAGRRPPIRVDGTFPIDDFNEEFHTEDSRARTTTRWRASSWRLGAPRTRATRWSGTASSSTSSRWRGRGSTGSRWSSSTGATAHGVRG